MRVRLAMMVLSLMFAVAACDGSTEPKHPNVTGTWRGSVGSTGATMRLTLSQDGSTVSGNGSIVSGSQSISLNASGTYAAPTLSMTISSEGYEPMNFSGTVAETQITGTLNGSGFVNSATTLQRQ